MKNRTELNDWMQWKEVCTIARCSKETRQRLAIFGRARLRNELQRAGCQALAQEYAGEASPPESAWLAIEGFLLTNRGPADVDARSSKTYKKAFIDNREETISAFEGGMTMLIRQNVVPSIAHGEDSCPRGKTGKRRQNITKLSLDSGDVDLEWVPDEWADPASEADLHIVEKIAVERIEMLLARLSRDQKIVLMCKLLGLPLDYAVKAKAVACKKTQLAVRYQEIIDILRAMDWGFEANAQEQYVLSRALIAEMHKWVEGPELADVRGSIMSVGSLK